MVKRRLMAGIGGAMVLACLVVLAACSKTPTSTVTTPTTPPTPTPSVTPTVATPTPTPTVTVTPRRTVSPTPSKSPTPKVTVTATATPTVTPTAQISPGLTSSTIKPGAFISLTLAQATDGSQWVFQTKPDPAVVAVASDQTLPNARHRWIFQGVAPGTTNFTVVEQGPGSGAVSSTFSYTLVVSP